MVGGDEGVRWGVAACWVSYRRSKALDLHLHDIVRLDQAVLDGLLQSHSCTLLILEHANIEGERASLLLHVGEHGTRGLHLELIRHVRIALVDGRASILNARLCVETKERRGRSGSRSNGCAGIEYLAVFARRNQDIDAPDLTLIEGCSLKLAFLRLAWVQDDALLAVNNILGLLAGEHAFGMRSQPGRK